MAGMPGGRGIHYKNVRENTNDDTVYVNEVRLVQGFALKEVNRAMFEPVWVQSCSA